MKRIERTEYLNKLIAFKDKSLIKVIETKRYNIKGKQQLKTLGKYYLVDIGLRRMLLGSRSFDAGRILENIVYQELLHRQQKVYIGKMDNLEVDFVAIDENDIKRINAIRWLMGETELTQQNEEVTSMRSLLRSVGCFQPDILSISHTSQIVTPRITENLISQPRIFEKYPVDCFNPELSRICSRILHCPIPTVV